MNILNWVKCEILTVFYWVAEGGFTIWIGTKQTYLLFNDNTSEGDTEILLSNLTCHNMCSNNEETVQCVINDIFEL